MKSLPLHEARQVWRALFRAGVEVPATQWQAWSDARLPVEQEPPSWLLALSTCQSSGSALTALEQDIGFEAECSLDPEALAIGFVVMRQLRGELTLEGMWAKLCEVSDVAEFLDSGKWKSYESEEAAQEVPRDPPSVPCLSPVASYASEKLFLLLSSAAGV